MNQNIFKNHGFHIKINLQKNNHLELYYNIPGANAFIDDAIQDSRFTITPDMNLDNIFKKEINVKNMTSQLKKGFLN